MTALATAPPLHPNRGIAVMTLQWKRRRGTAAFLRLRHGTTTITPTAAVPASGAADGNWISSDGTSSSDCNALAWPIACVLHLNTIDTDDHP